MRASRMRVFAGPNGSGKSTLKSVLPPQLLGHYLNPDDIEAEIRSNKFLDLGKFELTEEAKNAILHIRQSTFLQKAGLASAAQTIHVSNHHLAFPEEVINSYFASVISDFIRRKLIAKGVSFTFETVMSRQTR